MAGIQGACPSDHPHPTYILTYIHTYLLTYSLVHLTTPIQKDLLLTSYYLLLTTYYLLLTLVHLTTPIQGGRPSNPRRHAHLAATCPCSVQRERAEIRAHIQDQGQALRIAPITVGGMLARCAVRYAQLLAVASRVVKDPVLVDIVEAAWEVYMHTYMVCVYMRVCTCKRPDCCWWTLDHPPGLVSSEGPMEVFLTPYCP